MISEIHPIQSGLRPPISTPSTKAAVATLAAANAAANRPPAEDIQAFAGQLRHGLVPGGFPPAPASLPGLGGQLDLYDTAAKPALGSEPVPAPPDFPYLKPLAGPNPGNRLDTLI